MPSVPPFSGDVPFDEGDDLTPRDLATALAERRIALVDVREPHEWSLAHLAGARLIPLGTIPLSVGTMKVDDEIVLYCHHGMRSAMAAQWLRDQGFQRVRNLIGGIDRWSIEVDPSIPRY